MKYKVGDYVTRDQTILVRIGAVVPGDSPADILYGLDIRIMDKTPKVQWLTEWELDKFDFAKKDPDFKLWGTLAEGDLIRTGVLPTQPVVRVIKRMGDLVMISEQPVPRQLKNALNELSSQIEELTNGGISKAQVQAIAPGTTSITEAHRSSHGHWHTVEQLALMNWVLLRE